ncbi:MAG: hypothetical protein GMKNLPBB_02780 [Myxococcota bacterium]|nr:hypothetical protein [Myxococcota bacterium]
MRLILSVMVLALASNAAQAMSGPRMVFTLPDWSVANIPPDPGPGPLPVLSPNGATCTVATLCESGNCVEGVCCNTPCNGTCVSCLASKKGGQTGTCGNIPSGQDPDNECAEQKAQTCGTTGVCDGAGGCAYHPNGTRCVDDGNPCTDDLCNNRNCAHPNRNNGVSCNDDGDSCTEDICQNGSCNHPKKADQSPCAADQFECTSDVCLGGKCEHPIKSDRCLIDNRCYRKGDVPGSVGCKFCLPESSQTQLSNRANGASCDDGKFCTSSDKCQDGVCAGGEPLSCGVSGNPCIEGFCDETARKCSTRPARKGQSCGAAACDGTVAVGEKVCNSIGECVESSRQECAPFQCAAAVCSRNCQTDNQCSSGTVCVRGTCRPPNRAPVANAGIDFDAPEQTDIKFDGRGSFDPDGDRLTFSWKQISGPAAVVSGLNSPTPEIRTPSVNASVALVLELTVSDGELTSAPARVRVLVLDTINDPPVAVIKGPGHAPPGGVVTLDGVESSDPNGDPLTYKWSVVSGTAFNEGSFDGPFLDLAFPESEKENNVVVQLIVNDGKADSFPASHVVVISESPPDAGAGDGPASDASPGTAADAAEPDAGTPDLDSPPAANRGCEEACGKHVACEAPLNCAELCANAGEAVNPGPLAECFSSSADCPGALKCAGKQTASPAPDAGVPLTTAPGGSGCGCAISAPAPSRRTPWVLAAALLALALRRRIRMR